MMAIEDPHPNPSPGSAGEEVRQKTGAGRQTEKGDGYQKGERAWESLTGR